MKTDVKKAAERIGTRAAEAVFQVLEMAGKRMTKLAKEGRKKVSGHTPKAKASTKAA